MNETDWTKDGDLIAKAHKETKGGCQSVLVGNWQGKRGAVKCVAEGNHSEHVAQNGLSWKLGESGHWEVDLALTDVNCGGANGPDA